MECLQRLHHPNSSRAEIQKIWPSLQIYRNNSTTFVYKQFHIHYNSIQSHQLEELILYLDQSQNFFSAYFDSNWRNSRQLVEALDKLFDFAWFHGLSALT